MKLTENVFLARRTEVAFTPLCIGQGDGVWTGGSNCCSSSCFHTAPRSCRVRPVRSFQISSRYVLALSHRCVQTLDDVLILFFHNPVEEISGDAIAGIVVEPYVSALPQPGHIGAVALGFIQKPTEVISHAFDQPPWRPGCVGICTPRCTILLNDMNQFVHHRTDGFAFEV